MIGKNVKLGKKCRVHESVLLGVPSREHLDKRKEELPPTLIGDNAVLRSGTVIYCDVKIGNKFQTGHNVLIREKTEIGNNVLIGTNSVVEGYTKIGSGVVIQSSVYIPMNTAVGDRVFLGPNAVLTNDKYPLRIKGKLNGPVIRRSASIGANSTILPGVEIGEGAMVAAGAIVTKDVPEWKLAVGTPAKIKELPKKLMRSNEVLM